MSGQQQTQETRKPESTSQKQTSSISRTGSANWAGRESPSALIQRGLASPGSLTPADVLQLQRSVGNRAVGRLLGSGKVVQVKRSGKRPAEEPGAVQLETDTHGQGSREVSGALDLRPEGAGTPLPGEVADNFIRAGYPEVAQARVHVDDNKAGSANALAYTMGTEIVAKSKVSSDPETLGHEATHVIQQSRGDVRPEKANSPINSDPALEKNADDNGARVARGEQVQVWGPGLPGHAKQGGFPVQMKREDKAGLLGMTVGDFNTHRKAEQMDWANTGGLSNAERGIIWNIIDWGISGLSGIKLDDIVKDATATPATMNHLKAYCGAINGKIGGEPTVPLVAVGDLQEAKKQGEWAAKLNAELGGRLVKATIPRERFELLIQDTTVAEKFLQYNQSCQPVIQTPTGKEIWAFVELVKNEGADILSYKTPLPEIRNYHKFKKGSLDKLKDDKGKKDLPLTLILHSVYDHNGAFHRASDISEVIENTKIRALLIEDTNLGRLQSLKRDGFQNLARDHGMGDKITQVMIAGHGGSTSMELGGSGTTITEDDKTKQDKVVPKEPFEKLGLPVYFGHKTLENFWNDFFEALFNNMGAQGGFQPTVVLNACLTNSNEVDTEELKKKLKEEGTIDVDDSSVDPTTQVNQVKIRAGIKEYIQKNGSLATLLGGKAGVRADVKGANASITSSSATFIHTAGPDEGKLDIIASTDSKVAAPKIQYVREGKEPVGAIKAVIETWAFDSAAKAEDTDCFKKMDERTKDSPATTADEFIIRLLYGTIMSTYKNNILAANSFVNTANVLHGVAAGGAECRASKLNGDPMIQAHKAAFYGALTGFLAGKNAKLAIYQDWMQGETSKRKDFADMLGDAYFDRNSAKDYLDFTLLDTHIPEIFKLGAASTRGKILLALIGFIEKKRDDCKQQLLSLVTDNKLPTSVKDELQGYSEDTLRSGLGLPVEVPDVLPPIPIVGGAKPDKQKNVAAGSGTNNYYVEPLPATVKKMTKSSIGDWAKLRTAPDSNAHLIEKFYRKKDFTIVGEVKTTKEVPTGWYMLRLDSGRVGYMKKKYF